MNKFWESLQSKGKYATIIGLILGLVSTIVMCVLIVKNRTYEYMPFVIAHAISIFYLVLPSSIIVSYKDFHLEIKD